MRGEAEKRPTMTRYVLIFGMLASGGCVLSEKIGGTPETDGDGQTSSDGSAEAPSSAGTDDETPDTDGSSGGDDPATDDGSAQCPVAAPAELEIQQSNGCGDLSFIGRVEGLDAWLVVRAPGLVGMPWDDEGLVTATYTLPDPRV